MTDQQKERLKSVRDSIEANYGELMSLFKEDLADYISHEPGDILVSIAEGKQICDDGLKSLSKLVVKSQELFFQVDEFVCANVKC